VPYAVLRLVAKGPLPMTFTSKQDIEHLEILNDAGWIKVRITTFRTRQKAVVTELTPLGRWAMQHCPLE
jgi:hypothetical protein